VTRWLRSHPLALWLPLQAALSFFRLGLLSPWGDEIFTLSVVRRPMAGLMAAMAGDPHPPLYYALVHVWLHIPLGLDRVVQLRALSVVFALLATLAFDRLWASRLAETARFRLLALWCLSPCLLLYARMCRSYSLQLLVATVAMAWILRFADGRSWRTGAATAVSLTVMLYTHYVPGLALLAAVHVVILVRDRRRWKDLAALDAFLALAYLPWILRLADALAQWGGPGRNYAVTGSAVAEIVVKVAIWAASFVLGEAVPDVLLPLGALVALAAAALLLAGARRNRDLVWLGAPAAAVGLAGVARWVSYPFIPARMLFLFPLYLLLLVSGMLHYRRAGNLAFAALMLASLSGVWCYFHQAGFIGMQYAMPMREIAALIETTAPRETAVVVDRANSDCDALEYALGGARPLLYSEDALARNIDRDPAIHAIWFLRSTHDISPGRVNDALAGRLLGTGRATVRGYMPFSPLRKRLIRAIGIARPPDYFQELIEYRR
jgi:hypothetical protein